MSKICNSSLALLSLFFLFGCGNTNIDSDRSEEDLIAIFSEMLYSIGQTEDDASNVIRKILLYSPGFFGNMSEIKQDPSESVKRLSLQFESQGIAMSEIGRRFMDKYRNQEFNKIQEEVFVEWLTFELNEDGTAKRERPRRSDAKSKD